MMPLSTLNLYSDDQYMLLPLRVNWASKFRVSYEFKTDIIVSGNGKEQRRAVRENPRKTLEFSAIAHRNWKLLLDYFFAEGQKRIAIFPEVPRQVQFNEALPHDAQSVRFHGSRPAWLRTGMMVCIFDRDKMETRVVSAVSDFGVEPGIVSFSDSSDTLFDAGTRMSPALQGRCRMEVESRHLTKEVGTLSVQFEVLPGFEQYNPPVGTSFVDAREFFDFKPNWSSPLAIRNVSERDVMDYGFGRIGSYFPNDFVTRIMQGSYLGKTQEEVDSVVNFFCRMRGRHKEFLSTTWEDDIPYFSMPGFSFAITIEGTDFGLAYQNSTVHRRLMLRFADGRYSHHLIEDVAVIEDTNSTVLSLRTVLPGEALTPITLDGVSWTFASRFATDRLDVDWITDQVAQFGLSIQTLENFEL